ncbi:phosphatidate cytidylyltransferase [Paraflavitalea speifideaquila]|uniref:phosphatidate cytidylyltransferase n=1 Tax=Paraflavitalea speifideaquila TaxID=3076558 RepID=UPI0028ECC4F7|nr:phosphatidate cytidylyltransferase [Paraflavitalea speifideiaquila]
MTRIVFSLMLLLVMINLSSCEVIGGIFKAGVWTGVLAVVIVGALLIWIIARISGKK